MWKNGVLDNGPETIDFTRLCHFFCHFFCLIRIYLMLQVLRGPWWVLPSEVLHGLTFAAMWAATTDYAHGIAPGTLDRDLKFD